MPGPRVLIFATLLSLAACAPMPSGNASVPQPAKSVALDRYLGRWYEHARYDSWFERDCEGATADYAALSPTQVSVVNACTTSAGKQDSVRGTANLVEGAGGAKLRVSFFWPIYGNYWVLDHADDYTWSIVSEPSGRFLWILTRAPVLPPAQSRALVDRAAALGFDVSRLHMTRQVPPVQ